MLAVGVAVEGWVGVPDVSRRRGGGGVGGR